MMKVCVTGGAGMIGSALVKSLTQAGHDVLVVDNLWRGRLEYLRNDVPAFPVDEAFFNVDLADPSATGLMVQLLQNCDALIHLADIVAGIGYVFKHQYDIFRINNVINTNVIRACAQAGVPRVLYAGTACSFPKSLQRSLDSVLREDQLFPAEPESAYGWSKLIGTLELEFMAEARGTAVTTLMLHNVYGPNCDVDPRTSQVIPSLIRRMIELDEGGQLAVWGSGRQGRAFVHVDDVVVAFRSALEKDGLPRVIQIGPGECTSIRQLVELLRDEVLRKDVKIYYDLTKPEGDLGRCADCGVASDALGWRPEVSLELGLADTAQWIEKQLRVIA
jgi:GDP-D-mannose 3', 5'-epimerase